MKRLLVLRSVCQEKYETTFFLTLWFSYVDAQGSSVVIRLSGDSVEHRLVCSMSIRAPRSKAIRLNHRESQEITFFIGSHYIELWNLILRFPKKSLRRCHFLKLILLKKINHQKRYIITLYQKSPLKNWFYSYIIILKKWFKSRLQSNDLNP